LDVATIGYIKKFGGHPSYTAISIVGRNSHCYGRSAKHLRETKVGEEWGASLRNENIGLFDILFSNDSGRMIALQEKRTLFKSAWTMSLS